jgi:hypothetical protein
VAADSPALVVVDRDGISTDARTTIVTSAAAAPAHVSRLRARGEESTTAVIAGNSSPGGDYPWRSSLNTMIAESEQLALPRQDPYPLSAMFLGIANADVSTRRRQRQ